MQHYECDDYDLEADAEVALRLYREGSEPLTAYLITSFDDKHWWAWIKETEQFAVLTLSKS